MTFQRSTEPPRRVQDRDEAVAPDPSWGTLYSAGGVSALVFVVLVLIPVALVFAAPVPPVVGRELLPFIASHKVVYLIELVCFVGLSVPALVVFSAVAVASKGVNKSVALVGGLLGVVSEVIALALGSSPQSLHGGLVVLSNSYTTAETDAERAGLVSAAEALIAATNSVSWAGILTAAGILVLSSLMTRGCFGRALMVFGVFTGTIGMASEALRPMIGPAYLVYGLLLPTWFGLVGWRLLRVGRRVHEQEPVVREARASRAETVEVRLEELGEHSWVKALANTPGGSFGSAQYRFVACPLGAPHLAGEHVVTGATFPVMRFQDLDDVNKPNAWIETAQERLQELDDELLSRGWRRSIDSGQHWWSRTYTTRCGRCGPPPGRCWSSSSPR